MQVEKILDESYECGNWNHFEEEKWYDLKIKYWDADLMPIPKIKLNEWCITENEPEYSCSYGSRLIYLD